jgi:hypothetical protein
MREETIADEVLREFLLGGLADDERDRIEDQFLTDVQTRERILAAEQDLIEDYLEDTLTTADREKFVSLYARTPEQRRKLRITKSIKNWAITEAASPRATPARVSSWDRLRNWLRMRPAVIPIAVVIMIAIVIGAVWLNRRIEERNRLSAIEQELAQLNSPSSMREIPAQMTRVTLSPVAPRGSDNAKEITRENVQVVELVLPWNKPERYSKYQVEVRRVDGADSFKIGNPVTESDGDYAIRVRLSASRLRRGQYQIELSGLDPDGSVGSSEEYIFSVRD